MFDTVLLVCLLAVVPGWQVWRSCTESRRPPESRSTRYRRAIFCALALALLLVVDWVTTHRPVSLFGLDWPLSRGGVIGLAIAIVLLSIPAVHAALIHGHANAAREAKATRAAADLLPQTIVELRLFLLFVPIAGIMWELLYRGYLLWALTPHLGTPGAIVVAAFAYGLAHGIKNMRQSAASLGAALAFTIGYALTGSLWWLIMLHIGLPLLGLWQARRQVMVAS